MFDEVGGFEGSKEIMASDSLMANLALVNEEQH